MFTSALHPTNSPQSGLLGERLEHGKNVSKAWRERLLKTIGSVWNRGPGKGKKVRTRMQGGVTSPKGASPWTVSVGWRLRNVPAGARLGPSVVRRVKLENSQRCSTHVMFLLMALVGFPYVVSVGNSWTLGTQHGLDRKAGLFRAVRWNLESVRWWFLDKSCTGNLVTIDSGLGRVWRAPVPVRDQVRQGPAPSRSQAQALSGHLGVLSGAPQMLEHVFKDKEWFL